MRGHAKGSLAVGLGENFAVAKIVGSILLELDTDDWESMVVHVNISCGKWALFFRYEGEGTFDMLEFELS